MRFDVFFLVAMMIGDGGCGGPPLVSNEFDPPPDLAGADPITLACADLMGARQDYSLRCFGPAGPHGRPFDERAAIDSCVGIARSTGSRVTVDNLRTCAAAFPTAACGPVGGAWPACLDSHGLLSSVATPGTGAAGDTCFAPLQCASGICDTGGMSCGTCRAVGATECGGDAACVAGMDCVNGQCQWHQLSIGDACWLNVSPSCAANLYCKSVSGSANFVCAASAGAGEACDATAACRSDLYCADHHCAARLPDGAKCTDGECQGGCFSGTCQPFAWGLTTGSCGSRRACRGDFRCVNGLCRPYAVQGEGQDCSHDWGCRYDLGCVGCEGTECFTSARVCKRLPATGECTNGQCGFGSLCWGVNNRDRGRCLPIGHERAAGSLCLDDLGFSKGLCVPWGDGLCP